MIIYRYYDSDVVHFVAENLEIDLFKLDAFFTLNLTLEAITKIRDHRVNKIKRTL